MHRLVVRAVRALPAPALRRLAQWLMRGPRSRRILRVFGARLQGALSSRILRGPMSGLYFAGGDTPGYLLGATEPGVQRIFLDVLRPGDVVFDVGANIGYLTLLACTLVGPNGHVHCFEPVRESA